MTTVFFRAGLLCCIAASLMNIGPFPSQSSLQPAARQPEPVPLSRSPLQKSQYVKHRRTITFLMRHDAMSYFLYRGGERGFEYELARAFAKELGVTLEIRTPPPGIAPTTWLAEGRGDVAAGLVVTDQFDPGPLRLSVPYLETTAAVITRKDAPVLRAVMHRAGGSVSVHSDVRARQPLLPAHTFSVRPLHVEGPLHEVMGATLPAAKAVLERQVAAAIVTAPLARLAHIFYPNQFRTAFTLPQPIRLVWAVQPERLDLLQAINAYLRRVSRSGFQKILFEKYFVFTDRFRDITQVPGFTLTSRRLSRYDPLIAHYAEKAGFDWRLVAALIFEESRFDHSRVSGRGARGLMQITPIAAQEVGIKDYKTPRSNIETGVRYLQLLSQQFPYGHQEDRLALVLAGYLLGPSRVEDAQRLARTLGYDPHRWHESMDRVLPLLEDPVYYRQTRFGFAPGRQAVRYANAILKRYALYTRYVSRELGPPIVEAHHTEAVQAASAAG